MPVGQFIPSMVPAVFHVETAAGPDGCINQYGNVVVPFPPVKIAEVDSIAETEAAGAPVKAFVPPLRFTAVVAALAVQAVQVPVRLVMAKVGDALKVGAATPPVKFPKTVLADCVNRVASTVPEVVTAVLGVDESTTPSPVKVTLVTVPDPPAPPTIAITPFLQE